MEFIKLMKHEHLFFRCPLFYDPDDLSFATMKARAKSRTESPDGNHYARTPWIVLPFLGNKSLAYILPKIKYYTMSVPKSKDKGAKHHVFKGNAKKGANRRSHVHTTTKTAMHPAHNAMDILHIYVLVMRMKFKVRILRSSMCCGIVTK
jgi:hypothetical protein